MKWSRERNVLMSKEDNLEGFKGLLSLINCGLEPLWQGGAGMKETLK